MSVEEKFELSLRTMGSVCGGKEGELDKDVKKISQLKNEQDKKDRSRMKKSRSNKKEENEKSGTRVDVQNDQQNESEGKGTGGGRTDSPRKLSKPLTYKGGDTEVKQLEAEGNKEDEEFSVIDMGNFDASGINETLVDSLKKEKETGRSEPEQTDDLSKVAAEEI